MNRLKTMAAGAAVTLGVVLAAGCAKKPPTTAAEAPPAAAPGPRPPVPPGPASTTVAPPPSVAPVHDATADVLSQDLATLNRKGYLADAYFDYDRASLRDDARTDLSKDSEWLKKFPSVQVL